MRGAMLSLFSEYDRHQAMIASAFGAVAEHMDIEFHEINGTNGSAVFGGLLDYVDKQISKLVVGQTMTSDDGASQSQAQVHNEVRLELVRADAGQLGITINRDLIKSFVDLNFGPQERYPRAEFPVPDPEDLTVLSDGLAKLVPLGLRVKAEEVRGKFGLSAPGAGDELLEPQKPDAVESAVDPATGKPVPQKPAGKLPAAANDDAGKAERKQRTEALAAITFDHKRACRCGACTAMLAAEAGSEDALDQVDALFAEAMDDWEAMAAPIVAPMLDIIANAGSFEDALKLIEKAGPDASKMAESLARLTAIARGIGDIAD